jgi:hypothetical protein
VRSAEKSQNLRALCSLRVIRGKNMIRAQSHSRSFSATYSKGKLQTSGLGICLGLRYSDFIRDQMALLESFPKDSE